jgi:uncharacterized protein YihD (DUF1040 family)
MDINYIDTEPTYYVVKDYGFNNENLKVEELTEVYVVIYKLKKKGSNEDTEIHTFTTDFEQAFKRFKILPNTKALLKRFLTDDDNLIKLAIDGTKPKINEEDLTDEQKGVSLNDIIGRYRDDDDDGKPILLTSADAREPTEEELKRAAPLTENKESREIEL